MKISRQTFGRILSEARKAVTEAIVKGLVLRIEGGEYRMNDSGAVPSGACNYQAAPERDPDRTPKGDWKAMRKIAISSEGPDLDGPVDPRFGRAAGFVIIDPDTMASEYVDNAASQGMAQGAGIQTAELMTRCGVGVVLTGYVGPKAFQALSAAGIKIGQNLEDLSVRQAVDQYQTGQVSMAGGPNRGAAGGHK
jgi:predicted Fe-Mo cluster-binding NifX family protein